MNGITAHVFVRVMVFRGEVIEKNVAAWVDAQDWAIVN